MTRNEQGNYIVSPTEALALWEATSFFLEHAEDTEDLADERETISAIQEVFAEDLSEEDTVGQVS